MMSVGSYLLGFMCFAFWAFRVAVAVATNLGQVFVVQPIGALWVEVIVLFASFVSLLFVVRKNVAGCIIYLGIYLAYFLPNTISNVTGLINGSGYDLMMLFVDVLGIALAAFELFDTLLYKERIANPHDKKTDWFYKNKEYDREMDERADKNQYKTL